MCHEALKWSPTCPKTKHLHTKLPAGTVYFLVGQGVWGGHRGIIHCIHDDVPPCIPFNFKDTSYTVAFRPLDFYWLKQDKNDEDDEDEEKYDE